MSRRRAREAPSALELEVRGYECQRYRDDATAFALEMEHHLIPCHHEGTTKVDRFDVRQLETTNSGHDLPEGLDAGDDELDLERYYDIIGPDECPHLMDAVAMVKGEHDTETDTVSGHVQVRGAYSVVPFDYNQESAALAQQHPHPPPPPMDDGACWFVPTIPLPPDVGWPHTSEENDLIYKTAAFVIEHGGQAEVVLRVKCKNEFAFGFLQPVHRLYSYYCAVKKEAGSASTSALPMVVDEAQTASSDAHKPLVDYTSEDDAAVLPADLSSEAVRSTPAPRVNLAPDVPLYTHASTTTRLPLVVPEAVLPAPVTNVTSVSYPASRTGPAAPSPALLSRGGEGFNALEVVEKTAAFVADAGLAFEATIKEREKLNPRFAFLLPWNPLHTQYKARRDALLQAKSQAMPPQPAPPATIHPVHLNEQTRREEQLRRALAVAAKTREAFATSRHPKGDAYQRRSQSRSRSPVREQRRHPRSRSRSPH